MLLPWTRPMLSCWQCIHIRVRRCPSAEVARPHPHYPHHHGERSALALVDMGDFDALDLGDFDSSDAMDLNRVFMVAIAGVDGGFMSPHPSPPCCWQYPAREPDLIDLDTAFEKTNCI